jgi:chloride channel 3/4/5
MTAHRTFSGSTQPRHSTAPERRVSRRFSGFSVRTPTEHRDAVETDAQAHDPTLTEEINEIKRYEDFTTIDWVHDAVQEQARRRVKRREGSGFWDQEGVLGWRRKLRESYDAGQAWLVVTIVGAAVGLNAAFLNIVTEWLSDAKLGYCTTAFYLNAQFCCWGSENGMAKLMNTVLECC